jgi:hypothetical protein
MRAGTRRSGCAQFNAMDKRCRLKTPTRPVALGASDQYSGTLAAFGSTALPPPEMVLGAHLEAKSGPKANTGSTPGNVVVVDWLNAGQCGGGCIGIAFKLVFESGHRLEGRFSVPIISAVR